MLVEDLDFRNAALERLHVVGQLGENQCWKTAGKQPGDTVRLTPDERTVALDLVREGKTTLLEANRVTAMA